MLVETSMKTEIYTHCVNLETQISVMESFSYGTPMTLLYISDTLSYAS